MFEETLGHKTKEGKPFLQLFKELGIISGIKVDKVRNYATYNRLPQLIHFFFFRQGVKNLAGTNGETYTQGHDDLDKRCAKYYEMGCRFAKWCVYLHLNNTLGVYPLV